MQITETHNEGLERELKVVVPKDDLAAKLNERLTEMRGKIRINGFRQGKVPVNHIKKLYGKQVMAEIVNELVNNRTGEVLKGRDEKAAQQPEIAMTEDEKEAEDVLAGNADFEFSIKYEVMPEITLPDVSRIEIERPVAQRNPTQRDSKFSCTIFSGRDKSGDRADRIRRSEVDSASVFGQGELITKMICLGKDDILSWPQYGFLGYFVPRQF